MLREKAERGKEERKYKFEVCSDVWVWCTKLKFPLLVTTTYALLAG